MATDRRSEDTPRGVALGAYIKAQREQFGISIRQLAKRVNLSHGYLARMEAGVYTAPTPGVLHRIAEALDIDPEDLFALAGHIVPHELPSFTSYLRAKYTISDEVAHELSDYFQYMAKRYHITERDAQHDEIQQ